MNIAIWACDRQRRERRLVTQIRSTRRRQPIGYDNPPDGSQVERSGRGQPRQRGGQFLLSAQRSCCGLVASGKKMCAPCHTIGHGVRVGPDLRGVADHRDRTWLLDFIMNPEKVLARKDPQALALAAKFPAVHMPVMGLGETDAADVITYLKDQTSRLTASVQSPAVAR